MMSPFSNKYVEQEVEFYNLKNYNKNSIIVKPIAPFGRCDDYLNVNFVTDHPETVGLWRQNKLWMSLTRAELQGQYVSIQKAAGKVGIGGLGMGYIVLKIAAKDEVSSIDVYEQNPETIVFFQESFSSRAGFNKITFIPGDIREELYNKTYDFFFNDVYLTLLPSEVISDISLFLKNNTIGEYRFWGLELVKYILLTSEEYIDLCGFETKFFKQYIRTPGSKLRAPCDDLEFCIEINSKMNDVFC